MKWVKELSFLIISVNERPKNMDDHTASLVEYPNYTIYSDGRVLSKSTKKFIKFHERAGYMYTSLTVRKNEKSRRTTIGQHQIVARAFILNPNKCPIVNHKDGNGFNNSIENLEWATHKQNSQHAHDTGLISCGTRPIIQMNTAGETIKRFNSSADAAREFNCDPKLITRVCCGKRKTTQGFRWKYETEKMKFDTKEGEKWKDVHDHEQYKISSIGRIYTKKMNRFMSPLDRKDGYQRIKMDRKSFYVHRLVARTFLGEPPESIPNPVVNHKNGNKSDNTIDNLEWIDFAENVKHAHDTGLNSTSNPVVRYNYQGEKIKTYKSIAEAAKDVDVTHASIQIACDKAKKAYTIKRCIWRYVDDPPSEEEVNIIKQRYIGVDQYSCDGTFIKHFETPGDACKELGIKSPSCISHACSGKVKTGGGWVWRRGGDPPPGNTVVGCQRRVWQISKEGEKVKLWDSIAEAGKELGIGGSHITSVCKEKRKTTGGWRWKYE